MGPIRNQIFAPCDLELALRVMCRTRALLHCCGAIDEPPKASYDHLAEIIVAELACGNRHEDDMVKFAVHRFLMDGH